MASRDAIIEEVGDRLDGDTGCIIFDFSCYYPYQDGLIFDFQLGMDALSDKKLNHRYPNKHFHTISKKLGRKLSKIGYAHFVKLSDLIDGEYVAILAIRFGAEACNGEPADVRELLFPLRCRLTKEKPVCGLSMRFNIESASLMFITHYKKNKADIGFSNITWANQAYIENAAAEFEHIPIEGGKVLEGDNLEFPKALLFDTVIEPVACELHEFMI